MDTALVIETIAKVIKTAVELTPVVIKTVEDAKPFAQAIVRTLHGAKPSADDLAQLEMHIAQLSEQLQQPLPSETDDDV
jgi:hypothetical protein